LSAPPGGGNLPPPQPIDLCQPGRGLGWILGLLVGLLLSAAGSVAGLPAFFSGLLILVGLYAVGAWRSQQLARRGRIALGQPAPPWGVSLRVALLPLTFTLQPIWARPKAVLTVAGGMVHLWPVGLDLPVSRVRVSPGSRLSRGGVYLDTLDGRRFRLSFVPSFDVGLYFAPQMLDPKMTEALARLLEDEAARAVANLPAAGWYPDPGAPHQWRWWDGRGWTAHQR
jgi:hypothetical protein